MKDALAKRVQESANRLLSNAVGDSWDAQRSCSPCLCILEDVDASEGEGLIGPSFQTFFEGGQVLSELGSIQIDGNAIDARCSPVAFNAPESVLQEELVDTTSQGMSFDPVQRRPFQQSPWNACPGGSLAGGFVENVS